MAASKHHAERNLVETSSKCSPGLSEGPCGGLQHQLRQLPENYLRAGAVLLGSLERVLEALGVFYPNEIHTLCLFGCVQQLSRQEGIIIPAVGARAPVPLVPGDMILRRAASSPQRAAGNWVPSYIGACISLSK